MAKCEEGYLCDVCGKDVEQLTDSDLYLRYVIGMLDPETLLSAYAQGAFPMSDRDGIVRWYTADPRGVIPLDERFHVASTLRALVRQRKFDVRINFDFERTMQRCAEARPRGVPASGVRPGVLVRSSTASREELI